MGNLYLLKLLKEYGIKGWKIYKKLINPAEKEIKVPGYKQVCYCREKTKDKDIFRHIILEKDYDLELSFKPRTIIDAGAHAGYSTAFFANKFENAMVFAIEVDQDNFKYLKKNTSSYNNVTYFNNALWYKKTKLNINIENLNNCSIYVDENDSPDMVESVTIDEILNIYQIETIDILKIDIEGAEKELFENDPHSWLSKTQILIIELHDRKKAGCSKALFEALLKYNFETEVKSEYLIVKFRN